MSDSVVFLVMLNCVFCTHVRKKHEKTKKSMDDKKICSVNFSRSS